MQIIGIDPGLSGALAMVGPKGLEAVADMPTMTRGNGAAKVKNQVNAAALAQLLREWTSGHDRQAVLVVLEHQAPFRVPGQKPQGSSSVFSLGHTTGIIEGVVVACRLPSVEVTAGRWKKAFGVPGGKEHKGKARELAQRFYPEADLARKKDHNRAEAILIARYGYEEHA